MNLKIVIKTTSEITTDEWQIWVEEFNKIFHTHYDKNDFIVKYSQNPAGFSVHAMLYESGIFIGAQSYIIENFLYKDFPIRIACSCDTFIRKGNRKEFNTLFNMCEASTEPLNQYGVDAIIGNPSPKLFQYHIEVESGYKLIGKLYTYVLPLSLKAINKHLSFLDSLYCPFIRIVLRIRSMVKEAIYTGREIFRVSDYYSPYEYATNQDEIKEIRFSWIWNKESHIKLINDNFRHIGDVYKASGFLQNKFRDRIEAIIYITSQKRSLLPFVFFHDREIFMGKLLSDKISEADFYNIKNWEFKRGYFD